MKKFNIFGYEITLQKRKTYWAVVNKSKNGLYTDVSNKLTITIPKCDKQFKKGDVIKIVS